MQPAHPVEHAVGVHHYVSDASGVGGHLRTRSGDFRVREIESFEPEPRDASPGDYPHILLRATLTDWETHDFAGALSDALGISRERISWAGTKDKHAVTTQLFSVADADLDDLQALQIRDAEMKLLGRTGRPIYFGDLAGNEFRIVVREPEQPGAIAAITADLHSFAGVGAPSDRPDSEGTVVGVPNYFGQQRFGSRRPVTHEVGLAIVRGDWEAAVLAYVGNPSEREPETTREARRFVDETRDWEGALDRMPPHLGYERAMLHRLVDGAQTPADFREALETVPSTLQQLFVNAAQSYAFNEMLSRRLERRLPFDRPVEGDVVCFRDADGPDSVPLPDPDRAQRVTAGRLATVERHCERGRAFVTAPLVGTATECGEGDPGEIERAVLEDLDIAPGDFDLPGEFGSTGTRRAILVRTDLSVDEGGDGLAFDFALPKGSYATVLLREYLQTDPEQLA